MTVSEPSEVIQPSIPDCGQSNEQGAPQLSLTSGGDSPFSRKLTVGHAISELGAAVVLDFEPGFSQARLSPEGALIVAEQLVMWSQHASAWKKRPEEERAAKWIKIGNEIQFNATGADAATSNSVSEDRS